MLVKCELLLTNYNQTNVVQNTYTFSPQTNTTNNNEFHYLKKKIISITKEGGKHENEKNLILYWYICNSKLDIHHVK